MPFFYVAQNDLDIYASRDKLELKELSSCSFGFRQQNLCETPPSGEITMTSYPPCNITSLSRKPCIPDKKLL